jgi:signal transduction histidine kinase
MSSAGAITRTSQDQKAEFFLFEHSPIGLAQCQCDGRITIMNRALEQLLGVPPRHATWFLDLLHLQDRSAGARLLSELFDGKRDSFQVDSQTAGESNRWLRWTVWRVSESDGPADGALVMANDLPSTAASDHRLRQAERLEAVGRLAGGVAHDFNNLLTGVLLYCDLLLATIEPLHRSRKYAEEIRKAGLQATGLVRQLLAVARPANQEPRPLSLNEIAEGMRNLLVRLIGENIELSFQLDSHLGLIQMDSTQAQQILLNLVLNARDAMPVGGKIMVETTNCKVEVLTDSSLGVSRASLPCALFAVADTGLGMDAATRARLFEPFFSTKAGKGTGLGLATVHDIVTTNGGLIHVDSEPAQGTRISVLLPLVPAPVVEPNSGNGFHPVSDGEVLSSKEEE